MTPGFRNRCVRGSRVRFREVRGTAASTAGEGPWGRTGMGCGPDTPHTAAPGGPGSRPGRVGACSRRGPDARLEPSTAGFPSRDLSPVEKRPRAPGGSRLPQRVLGRAGGRSPPSWHPTLPTREQGLTHREGALDPGQRRWRRQGQPGVRGPPQRLPGPAPQAPISWAPQPAEKVFLGPPPPRKRGPHVCCPHSGATALQT